MRVEQPVNHPPSPGPKVAPRAAVLRVLSRPGFRNRAVNPYNASINDHLAKHNITIEEYRPDRPFRRSYDVVHVHWPETTFNHDVVSAAATTESLLLALRIAKRRGARIVWTAHNLFAQERRYPKWEAMFWRRFTPLLDGVISLTEEGRTKAREVFPSLATVPHWVLPHPHYRGQYPDTVSKESARQALQLPSDADVVLFFGNILEYKNLPALIDAFLTLGDEHPSLHLLIAGKPHDAQTAQEVRRLSQGHPRIQLILRHIDDSEVQQFFRACDLVALPYREVTNSGAALLALSFDRPVLMPTLGPLPHLQDKIGADWIHLYRDWSAEVLKERLASVRSLPERSTGEHLAAFGPEALAAQSAEIYRSLVAGNRPPC